MKKKIIIFTSSGGQGHISATKAIQAYLGNHYEIQPVYIFDEVFKGVDPSSVITFGRLTGEKIYNYFLRKRWYTLLNCMYRIGKWYFRLRRKKLISLATDYLACQKADIIISVTPIINGVLLHACQTHDLPFLLIPTDLDVSSFIVGIENPSYPRFHMVIGFDDPLIRAKLTDVQIPSRAISPAGLPVRSCFFEEKNVDELKEKYQIPTDRPVIILMMGGQGNTNVELFARQLAQLTIPAHIIIFTGKDLTIRTHVERIQFNKNLSTSIISFTDHVSDLMAMGDLLITKSGSVSFCEGIYLHLPMILDATATILYWERLNHRLLQEHDWGTSLRRTEDLLSATMNILKNPAYDQAIKESLKRYPKSRLDQELKPLIEKLLASKSVDHK